MSDIISLGIAIITKGIPKASKELAELEKQLGEVENKATAAEKAGHALGTGINFLGKAGLAAAVGLAAFGKVTFDAAKAIENSARVSGIGVEEFQRHAFAAKQVGIEQEKLGDIFKDVNDKLGDFATTGAGPLADFFDTIGKKVGVTAENFKGLSGPDALGLYVSTLQKAGASQQEMTFFMESLAGDAALLTPLLLDNAAGLKAVGGELDVVLSQSQIDQTAKLNKQFDLLASQINTRLQSAFINASIAAADFFGLTKKGVIEADLDLVNDDIEGWGESLEALKDNELTDLAIEMAKLQGIEVDTNWFRDDNIADKAALIAAIESKLKGSQEQARKLKGELLEIETAVPVMNNLGAATQATTENLKRQGEIVAENAKKKAEQDALAAKNQQIINTQIQKAHDIYKAYIEGIDGEAEAIRNSIDPKRAYNAELERTNELLRMGKITAAEAAANTDRINESIAALGEETKDPMQELLDGFVSLDFQLAKIRVEGIEGLADGLTELMLSGGKDFKTFAAQFIKQIAAMIIKALIFKAIMDAIQGFSTKVDVSTIAAGSNYTGGAAFGQAFADHGGPVKAGQPVSIGTGAQPEVFVPTTSGTMYPGGKGMPGSSGINISIGNIVVQEKKDSTSTQQAEQISKAIARDVKQAIQGELINQRRSGNMLNPANVTGGFK